MTSTTKSFSPAADYTIAKMMTCMCLQNGWEISHLDLDNGFPNRRLDQPVDIELPKYVYSDEERGRSGMRLNISLYRLKDAGRIWSRLLFSEFKNIGLQKLRSAS